MEWLTSFCLADDSTNAAFHSLASFLPVSNDITLYVHANDTMHYCMLTTMYLCI